MTSAGLRRALSLRDLVIYGIVLVMPIAAVPLFGLVQQMTRGHAVSAILLAMIAMVITASSYGRMGARFSAAGSAYTFVRAGISPWAGFLAGWAMLLDYLLVPVLSVLYAALAIARLAPAVPTWLWCLAIVTAITAVNLLGVRSTASANLLLMVAALVVIVPFLVLAVRWLYLRQGWDGLFSPRPFYAPESFRWRAMAAGTALAALAYGGFDGVSTLAEEVERPETNIPLATIGVAVFTGIFGGVQVYLAQRVHPAFADLAHPETAFLDVTRTVGGRWMFDAMAMILIVTSLGSGLTAQAGVSRLLYAMGRDGVLPRRLFGYIHARTRVPSFNILLIGLLAFAGCLALNYERAAELINFGAFLAFAAVNLSAASVFYLRRRGPGRRVLPDLLLPLAGAVFSLAIWWNLGLAAKIAGGLWLVLGALYLLLLSGGLRPLPRTLEEGLHAWQQ